MSKYQKLKDNLDILEQHNETHRPVFHITNGQTHENDLIRELIADCRNLLNKFENGKAFELPCLPNEKVYKLEFNTSACKKCEHFHPQYYWDDDDYCMKDSDLTIYPEVGDKKERICSKHFVEIIETTFDLQQILCNFNKFGKVVFATKAEAKTMLKKLKGGKEG